jgi:nicotinamide-nucleotide amidase
MKAEIISIGDELLIGQTVNTNASWLGAELSRRGFLIVNGATIPDEEESIVESLSVAQNRSDLVVITGGLGPTKDDITKKVLCDFFETELELHEDVLEKIEEFFTARGREMLEVNRQQAFLPKSARIFENKIGTASGMLFYKNGTLFISLPGVPYEMKHICEDHFFPFLEEEFNTTSLHFETIHVQGIGESFLAERISDIEEEVRSKGYGFAYLPKPGIVRIRISGERSEESKEAIRSYLSKIAERLPQYVYTENDGSLAETVGKILKEKKLSVGSVESCTAGRIASEIVSVPGSSAYFMGSILSYTNELKSELVGVDNALFASVGAVSEEVVRQMAENGRKKLGTDYCVSTSGIAGPDGGSDEKPVGTVWIGVAGPDRTITKKFQFGDHRGRNIEKSMLTALNLLRCEILKINIEKS